MHRYGTLGTGPYCRSCGSVNKLFTHSQAIIEASKLETTLHAKKSKMRNFIIERIVFTCTTTTCTCKSNPMPSKTLPA